MRYFRLLKMRMRPFRFVCVNREFDSVPELESVSTSSSSFVNCLKMVRGVTLFSVFSKYIACIYASTA
jgi:hypothetical protein